MNENFTNRHADLRGFKIPKFWFLECLNELGNKQRIVFDGDFDANFEYAQSQGFKPESISYLKNEGFYISGHNYPYQEKLEKFNRKRKKTTFVDFLKQELGLEVL